MKLYSHLAVLCSVCLLTQGTVLAADPLPRGDPTRYGFSPGGLERIDRFFADEIAQNRIPGAVVAIARQGRLVYYTTWDYSLSIDALGMVVEKVTGKTLGAALEERVWSKVGMPDTTFAVAPDKKGRLARALPNDPITGKPQDIRLLRETPKFECGGGCALGTAADYIRFGQMLLNGGVLDGKRVLSPKTVEFMTSDHLGNSNIRNNVAGTEAGRDGYGFGLGVAVRTQRGVAAINGSVGDYTWNGANGTSYWADPKEQLVVVTMTAGPGDIRKYYREQMAALVYGAMDK